MWEQWLERRVTTKTGVHIRETVSHLCPTQNEIAVVLAMGDHHVALAFVSVDPLRNRSEDAGWPEIVPQWDSSCTKGGRFGQVTPAPSTATAAPLYSFANVRSCFLTAFPMACKMRCLVAQYSSPIGRMRKCTSTLTCKKSGP